MVSGESIFVCFTGKLEIMPVLMSRVVVTELADQNSLVSSVSIPCKLKTIVICNVDEVNLLFLYGE